MKYCLTNLVLLMMISACNLGPKGRTIPFEGIENARELNF